ncbi:MULTISPECIES: Tn3 family transposase [unclassified Rhodanobacter]|uniref:Tn3 family transposase n=1 Tax=unclassified Rhodanobacter TaxID=2621553 RepID=UPI0007A9A8FB|nr:MULTISPECIES: Tn3 family transposase [unclassified Rhodanobacter]KZC17504.1 transposase [Rhodanobacter sp. FW104-R8]KZC28408.1 transposase [Rhodanobacter sp. FW510-T8]KZC32435.1 transposase [Rhodanobacter sp. FW510-R10]
MASIDRTAYPQFKRNPVVRELVALYTVDESETAFIVKHARQPSSRLTLAILLKSFQRLRYFPALDEVPAAVLRHIRASLKFRIQVKPAQPSAVTLYRYHALIRKHLDFRPFEEGGLDVAARAMRDAAAIMDHPPDLINVGIEQLVTDRIGLPAFSTLDRLARRVRALVNGQLFATIAQRLTADEKARLDGLLQAAGKAGKSPLHEVKRLPKRSSLRHFQELIDHMERLDALVNTDAPLVGIPELKRKHFAAEARALDAAELKDFRPAKRHAVLLCLIHRARVQVRDDLAAMFIKRMSKIHVHGKEHLDRLRSQYREKAEVLVATMSDVIRVLAEQRSDTAAGREIRRLVGQRGSIDTLQEDCNAIAAHSGDNYLPLLWPYYKSHRPTLLRMVRILNLKSTTEDRSLIDALELILAQERQRGDWLDGPMDLSFTTHLWRKTLTQRTEDGEERIHRRHFEVCVFSALANELKSGDAAVPGSEEYADQGEQLLSWEECEPQVAAYCAEFGLPADPITFVNTLQSRLMQVAEQTDQEYVDNGQVVIDDQGMPVLKRSKAKEMSSQAKALETAIHERLRERSVIDVLCDVGHWTNWHRHFGPLSGSDPKIDQARERYVLTAFTYGCNLGPNQAARHFRGAVTAHMLSFVNRRHIDANKLAAACRDIINSYAGLQLPKHWGDSKRAAADGTKYEMYIQNSLASYHIRYGGYGGIAYHHVSDTYVALFSHFIPCGVWEAVYIIDGLLKNTSDIQPDIVHADTQGQSLPVFGLSYLLGIQLMPRIRNWQDYRFFRPDTDASYEHIDALFRDSVDWDLIETHWKDLMRVVLSIKAGKVAASTLLRRLGNNSRKNRLYHAFRALGSAVRTLFLLQYISDQDLREQITASTNKVEAYNGFSKYFFFGGEGIIADNDPVEQEKAVKYNDLVANAVIFHNVVEQTRIIRSLMREGWKITAEDVAALSPYMTSHIKRFGDYLIDAEAVPEPYEAELALAA